MFRVNHPARIFESKAVKEVRRRVLNAVTEPGGILAIIGEIGIGKTIAAINILGKLEEYGEHVIWCRQPDKERLKINVIMNAIIRYFGESPRRDIDARTEQLRRLMGKAVSDGKKVILVIDEAHALYAQTLRALKRILELNFSRRMGLLSIILVAQPEIYEKLNRFQEVALRTDVLEMKPLTRPEAIEFLGFVADWNRIKVKHDVFEYLATRCDVPLRLVVTLDRLNEIGRALGKPITKTIVNEYFVYPVKKKLEESGMSLRQAAAKAGISPAAASLALRGKYEGDVMGIVDDLKTALDKEGVGVVVRK